MKILTSYLVLTIISQLQLRSLSELHSLVAIMYTLDTYDFQVLFHSLKSTIGFEKKINIKGYFLIIKIKFLLQVILTNEHL